MSISLILLAVASYLSGGIPTGYLIARRLRGIDIREHGSGNPGAANVYRTLGAGAGLATLIGDSLKGFAPAAVARRMFPDDTRIWVLCGALAILGHIWTVFLGLRGGKGVATSAGVFAALLPGPSLPTVMVFLFGAAVTGHISVGSIMAAVALPAFAAEAGSPRPLVAFAAAAAVIVLLKHIPNMRRLAAGLEPSIKPRTTPLDQDHGKGR